MGCLVQLQNKHLVELAKAKPLLTKNNRGRMFHTFSRMRGGDDQFGQAVVAEFFDVAGDALAAGQIGHLPIDAADHAENCAQAYGFVEPRKQKASWTKR